jgi:hypothetical protein
MNIHGTAEQQLIYLNTHWGRRYRFEAPPDPGGQWAATDKYGQHETLQAPSAAGLLEVIRRHYQATYPLPEKGS